MSVNREHVIWQSANGAWNNGHYAFYNVGDSWDEDFDPEWDVEYTNDFWWVSMGHISEEAARRAWRGANPGGGDVVPYVSENIKQIEQYELKAAECLKKQ